MFAAGRCPLLVVSDAEGLDSDEVGALVERLDVGDADVDVPGCALAERRGHSDGDNRDEAQLLTVPGQSVLIRDPTRALRCSLAWGRSA